MIHLVVLLICLVFSQYVTAFSFAAIAWTLASVNIRLSAGATLAQSFQLGLTFLFILLNTVSASKHQKLSVHKYRVPRYEWLMLALMSFFWIFLLWSDHRAYAEMHLDQAIAALRESRGFVELLLRGVVAFIFSLTLHFSLIKLFTKDQS